MYLDTEFMDLMIKAGHGDYLTVGKKGNKIWNRYRGYEFIIYPEHFKDLEDIKKRCEKCGIMCCLSPIHDKDLKEDGSLKKPHYHLILYYDGKKTPYGCYCDFVGAFGDDSFATVERVGNMPHAVEYQSHIDNDDKAHYEKDDILGFNGFPVSKYLVQALSDDIMRIKRQIKDIIESKSILFFDELDDVLELENYELAEVVSRNRDIQRWAKDYLKSREHRLWYSGNVEKSISHVTLPNGTEKVIFNREIKGAI